LPVGLVSHRLAPVYASFRLVCLQVAEALLLLLLVVLGVLLLGVLL
jgi:hypothetical protein